MNSGKQFVKKITYSGKLPVLENGQWSTTSTLKRCLLQMICFVFLISFKISTFDYWTLIVRVIELRNFQHIVKPKNFNERNDID